MTSSTPLGTKRDPNNPSLSDRLASVLPQGYNFGVYHLSTPPTRTDPLYSAPPNERPDKTYCETHFLAVSIDAQNDATTGSKRASPGADEAKQSRKRVLVLGLEVLVFTTGYLTTIFVSKADSTGYLQLLKLPKGSPSPIREVSSTFINYLLEHRRRKDIQLAVSLFARAQAQYLFPGSVENRGKHVLDDWGLVRWWCKVLNPLLECQPARMLSGGEEGSSCKGYLIVPGLEDSEMRAFLPRTAASAANWVIGHPLERISHYTKKFDWVPVRCLIPGYPDDPKSRFRDELDDEAAKWKQNTGSWKSVKTLDQFWEMMAFRQECSSGRLTGFIWLVFDTESRAELSQNDLSKTHLAVASQPATSGGLSHTSLPALPPSTPPRRRIHLSVTSSLSSPLKDSSALESTVSTPPKLSTAKKKKKKKLTGRIIPRPPHIKTQLRNYLLDRPTSTAYYYWPVEGRGDKIVDEADYKRIVELLLHLDFSTLEKATGSTRRWIAEVGMGTDWGCEVTGTRKPSVTEKNGNGAMGQVTYLTTQVHQKGQASSKARGDASVENLTRTINVLGSGLVRRKKKDDENNAPASVTTAGNSDERSDAPTVNILGAGIVRKKR
ncbi:histone acetylation protein-domain-containing protein [Diplogelasinospora grovesii]|uniref:histone acetyltransferase n=1 Tax=Diplogelasinospora grovesii TaxID=303347 RepID=A0AAN6N3R1_9PEZI|nr:histone acetylation protein-domain-containing protein [Diplogelasinospora grovesii]